MAKKKAKKKKKTKKEKRRKHVGGTEAELNDGEVTHSGAIPTVQDDAETWGIDMRIVRGMQKTGIKNFFSIQR